MAALLLILCVGTPFIGWVAITALSRRIWLPVARGTQCPNCGHDGHSRTADGLCVECGLSPEAAMAERNRIPVWVWLAAIGPSLLAGLLPTVIFPHWPSARLIYYCVVALVPAIALVGLLLLTSIRRARGLALLAIVVPGIGAGLVFAWSVWRLRIPLPPPPAVDHYAEALRRGLTPIASSLLVLAATGACHAVVGVSGLVGLYMRRRHPGDQ